MHVVELDGSVAFFLLCFGCAKLVSLSRTCHVMRRRRLSFYQSIDKINARRLGEQAKPLIFLPPRRPKTSCRAAHTILSPKRKMEVAGSSANSFVRIKNRILNKIVVILSIRVRNVNSFVTLIL